MAVLFLFPACINPICGPDPKTSEIKRNPVMTSMDFGLELNYHEMFLIGKKKMAVHQSQSSS